MVKAVNAILYAKLKDDTHFVAVQAKPPSRIISRILSPQRSLRAQWA